MNETKSVKVDNWGVFFLQKLQNFFNKTDYCDLTLQFNDNSQLKVHRLVLSACTDYFNVLEHHHEVIDDTLIMPGDLQADVVVPIVNFMYTGTLEFEVNMYGRLLKTAKDMNMTVLLKLLEAHKRTVEVALPTKVQPILLNKSAGQRINTYSRAGGVTCSPQRTYTPRRQQGGAAILTKVKVERPEVVARQPIATKMAFIRKNVPEPVQLVTKYANTTALATQKGPSRFDCSESTISDQFESSFDNISYESRPLITASQIKEERDHDEPSGSFEQLRKSYTGSNKRAGSSLSFSLPPEKKPNIEDVKEYTEAHRMRKALVADEFEDDPDDYADDQYITNDFQNSTISESVVIKDEPGNVNHAKIISEVLKKYPHLVKNNKNIKLKIMQRGNQQTISAPLLPPPPPPPPLPVVAVKAKTVMPSVVSAAPPAPPPPKAQKKIDSKTMHALIALGAENVTGPWLCLKCGVNGRPISIPSYKGFRRHLINSHKERIDPLICEHCGQRTSKRAELFHHMLVQHSIKPPLGVRLPKCTECKYFAIDGMDLKKHRDDEHKKVEAANAHHCIYCNKTFSNEIRLYEHMRANHRQRAYEDGVMDFDEEDDDDDLNDKYVPNNAEQASTSNENKIKIISNIALPAISSIGNASTSASSLQRNINLEPSSEAEGLSNVASGIATSLGVMDTGDHDEYNDEEHNGAAQTLSSNYIEEAMANVHGEFDADPKKTMSLDADDDDYIGEQLQEDDEDEQDVTQFVTAEGSTLELTASQKADLLQQLQDQTGVVMILNHDDFDQNQQIVENPNQQGIVVVYSQSDETNNAITNTTVTTTTASASNGLEVAGTCDSQDSTTVAEPTTWQSADSAESDIKDREDDDQTSATNVDEECGETSKDPLDGGGDDDDDDDQDQDDKLIEAANDDKEKEEKVAAAAATKKLIEGDWSEDEEPDPLVPVDDIANDNPKSVQTGFPSSATAKRSYRGSRDTKGATTLSTDKTDDANEELDNPEKVVIASGDGETKLSPNVATTSATEISTADAHSEMESDEPPQSEAPETTAASTAGESTTTTAKNAASKVEINTLINDWGDDDDDEDEDMDKN